MKLRVYGAGVAALVFAGIGFSALAAPRDDVLEALGKCAAIADNAARLSCYDQLAPRVKDALNTPPAQLDRPPSKEEQESWFGFSLSDLFGSGEAATKPEDFGKERTDEARQQREVAEQEVSSITGNVTEYSFTLTGRFIVFLDNGQVWKQIQGDSEKAHFMRIATKNKVTISRGILGSYNLTINDSAKVFKVSRVK